MSEGSGAALKGAGGAKASGEDSAGVANPLAWKMTNGWRKNLPAVFLCLPNAARANESQGWNEHEEVRGGKNVARKPPQGSGNDSSVLQDLPDMNSVERTVSYI
jgi:hypothetical protein